MSNRILVAGFGDKPFRGLGEPFVEVNRLEPVYFFDNSIQVDSLALSEYEPFFRFFDAKPKGIDSFGLFHYRCHLDIDSILVDTVYVTSIDLGLSIYRQFVSCHSYLEEHLVFASELFLQETGFDALDYMNKNNVLFYRNLFVAPFEVALEWYKLSRFIAFTLVAKFGSVSDRWLGFILERLFSAFIVSKNFTKLQVVPALFLGEK